MCDETSLLERPAATGEAGPLTPFEAAQPGQTEQMIEISTQDGTCEAFFVHPSEGKHPGVLIWPDIFGVRPAAHAMARRLAGEGYAVLLVNPFYRVRRLPLGFTFADLGTEERRAEIVGLVGDIKPDHVERDAQALVAFLDAQDAVDTSRSIGTHGYCMGGSLALRTAAAVPGRVRAVASFHGGNLAGEGEDSPHRTLAKSRASYLILPGLDDAEREPHAVGALREAADAAGRPAEIEVYNANHGWCVHDNPTYDMAEAERAWLRLLALYAAL